MLNQFGVDFDIPQIRPPVPPPSLQTVELYETQPRITSPVCTDFALSIHRRADGVLSYLYEQPRPNRDFTAQLRSLQQYYTILADDHTITELMEEAPALYPLLIEAIKPLQHAFGEKRILQIRVQSSDEDTILKVAVQLPADFDGDPERALRSFDEEWWLNNCHRSGGTLVFDYETQNAI